LKNSYQENDRIDTHVHLRALRENQIIRGAEEAARRGIGTVFDMPNIAGKPLLRREDVEERLAYVNKLGLPVNYSLWIGLTPEEKQIKEAVQIVRENQWVVGLKLYTCPMPDNLGVTDSRQIGKIFRILAKLKYQGVIAVHCEKARLMKPEKWNPQEPWTHGLARPPETEFVQVKEVIQLAKNTGFEGRLHICHISLIETLEMVYEARKEGMRISGEITPHHLLESEERLRGKDGLIWKCNPPLRSRLAAKILRKKFIELVKKGADWLWIATDWAPHDREKNPYASGIADYSLYGKAINQLRRDGLCRKDIQRITRDNIIAVFEDKIIVKTH